MGIYIFSFAISAMLLYAAAYIARMQKSFTGRRFVYWFIVVIALITLSALAGFRDFRIGTDVLNYGNFWFLQAHNLPFHLYTKWATSSSIGYMYATFNYVVALFTNNPHIFYFWYCLIELLVVYVAIYLCRDIVNVPIAMIVFYFFFYNMYLNILRQGMALSLILLTWALFRKNRKLLAIGTLIVACQFHDTAIIGVIPIIIFMFSKKIKVLKENANNASLTKKNKLKRVILLKECTFIITMVILVFSFQFIIVALGKWGLASDRYLEYVNNIGIGSSGGFYIHLVLLCLPVLILYLINIRHLTHQVEYIFFTYVVLTATFLSFLANSYTFLSRFTLYFDIFFVFAIPYIFSKNLWKIRLSTINLNNVAIYLYGFIYWIVVYAVINSGETVPYIFMN